MSLLRDSFSTVLFVTASTFNIVALYLIVTRSRKEVGNYKYLLIAFLCTDSFFSLLHKLCQPTLSFRGGFFVSYCEGIIDSSFALTLYGAAGSLSFPLLAYHFLYRALVVSRAVSPRERPFRHSKLLVVFLTVFLLLEAAVWIVFNYELRLDPNDATIRAKIVGTHAILANRTELIVIVPIINGKLNPQVARNAWPLLAIAGSSFVTIVICAWKITHALYIQVSMSLPSMHMHRRLFIALIVQMLVPTCTMFAPSIAAIGLPFIPDVSIEIPDWAIGLCYSIYPLLDPIVIILCIRDYRLGLLQLLRIPCKQLPVHNSPVSISSLIIRFPITSQLQSNNHVNEASIHSFRYELHVD